MIFTFVTQRKSTPIFKAITYIPLNRLEQAYNCEVVVFSLSNCNSGHIYDNKYRNIFLV